MVRREEARLRAIFRRLVVVGMAAPAVACSSGSASSSSSELDASLPDATTSDAADEFVSFDGYVEDVQHNAWCSLGAPTFWDAGGNCDFFMRSPCGIPDGAVPLQCGALVHALCEDICDGGAPFGCQIVGYCGPDGAPTSSGEGGTPGQDDSGALVVECLKCNGGRRPRGLRARSPARARSATGELFAELAHLEHASVAAFGVLRDELRAHGAPSSLVRAAERAARDEARHARVTARLSRAHGGEPRRARVRGLGRRALFEVAVENAVEGCVRETYGACVAAWQAAHARDPAIAAAMARIAVDETRHAALAWSVARWASSRLGARARDLDVARQRAVEALRDEVTREPPREVVVRAGVPTAAQARAIVAQLARDLWS